MSAVGTITFDGTHKPHVCVSKDPTWVPINAGAQVVFGPDGATMLLATDGHTLSLVPCTVSDRALHGVVVPAEVLDAARKAAKKVKVADAVIEVGPEVWRLSTGQTFPRAAPAGDFPDYGDVLPPPQPEKSVCVDVRLLARVADALGDPYVVLTLGATDADAIRVEVRHSKAMGVVMPAHK